MYRNKRPMEQVLQMLTWDGCARTEDSLNATVRVDALGHVDTNVYCMRSWAMEPAQRILKVHANELCHEYKYEV